MESITDWMTLEPIIVSPAPSTPAEAVLKWREHLAQRDRT
jgi:hypothetical protein